jgi:hypothetical protein
MCGTKISGSPGAREKKFPGPKKLTMLLVFSGLAAIGGGI